MSIKHTRNVSIYKDSQPRGLAIVPFRFVTMYCAYVCACLTGDGLHGHMPLPNEEEKHMMSYLNRALNGILGRQGEPQ